MLDFQGTPLRSRLALAVGVAAACLGGCVGIASLSGSAPAAPERAPERAIRIASDHSHSGSLEVPGMKERELRAFEAASLGPEHAADHAAMRAEERQAPMTREQVAEARRSAAAAAVEVGAASEVGRWDFGAKVDLPIVAIHAALLPTGKVMVFSYPNVEQTDDNWKNEGAAWLWDPATGEKKPVPPPADQFVNGQFRPANIWCSGHAFTPAGELVVFGGNLEFAGPATNWKGLDRIYLFNPFTERWRRGPDMRHGRWYPTGVTLADGSIPIVSGLDESGTNTMNTDVEVFTPPSALDAGDASVRLIGNTTETLPYDGPWTGGYYPQMFAMPSGRVLVAGPQKEQTYFLKPGGFGTSDWFSHDPPDMATRHVWGTGVPLPGGFGGSTRFMMIGGSTSEETIPSNGASEIYDDAQPSAPWQTGPSLNVGRGHANTVLLPDGSMVEVGGGVGRDDTFASPLHATSADDLDGDGEPDHKQVELWDPVTGEWRLGPAQLENRAYHSTALLLPDGRVLSAGDEFHNAGSDIDTAEIYEPPYLFKGPRPTISSAPEAIKVGSEFGVGTPDSNVTKAVLVAPGAVTHAVNMSQRMIPLALTKRTNCVDLAAPPNANAAPPGYYMLFLLNANGVPSVAKFVKLTAGGDAPAKCVIPPPDPPDDPPDPPDPPDDPKPPVKNPPIIKPPTPPTPPVNKAPVVTKLKLSGKRISFRLSEPGTITIAFERKGRRSYARLGTTLTRKAKAGANSISFDPRKRRFKPGDYRVVARARDSSGKRSKTVKARFRVSAKASKARRSSFAAVAPLELFARFA